MLLNGSRPTKLNCVDVSRATGLELNDFFHWLESDHEIAAIQGWAGITLWMCRFRRSIRRNRPAPLDSQEALVP